uniref:Outer envelope protein 80, chloroplastic (Fragments) n=1 Tax=Pisum sativum TaxID=3888 RepID=OEP80_PEA|nr:RecName: Full=Outer envelope protein 80, chloroplastic; AltName: Full=Chloroplastic outer envelope protein of 80 kDa; Short=PsOEP80 [Pisum sativum]
VLISEVLVRNKLQVSEAEVNNISIRFLDRKSIVPQPAQTAVDLIVRGLIGSFAYSHRLNLSLERTPGTLVHGNQDGNSNLTIGRWSGTAGLIFQRYNSPLTASGNTHTETLLAKSATLELTDEQGLPVLSFAEVMQKCVNTHRSYVVGSVDSPLGPLR